MCGIITGACWCLVGVREKVLQCGLVVDAAAGDIGQVSNCSIGIKKIHPRKVQSHLQSFESYDYSLWLKLLKYTRGKYLLPSLSPTPTSMSIFLIWARTFLVRTWSKSTVCRSLCSLWCQVVKLNRLVGSRAPGALVTPGLFSLPGLSGGRFQPQPIETWLSPLWSISGQCQTW